MREVLFLVCDGLKGSLPDVVEHVWPQTVVQTCITRWTMHWKPVIHAFAITFSDRWRGAETY